MFAVFNVHVYILDEDKRIKNINKNLFFYYIFRRVKTARIVGPDEGGPRSANRLMCWVRRTLVVGATGRVQGRRPLDGVEKRQEKNVGSR